MDEDLLHSLSDCIKNNRNIKEINGKICLAGRQYAKTMEAFPSKLFQGRKFMRVRSRFYNLGEIVFLIENLNLPHDEYSLKAKEEKIRCVMRADRYALLERLDCSHLIKIPKPVKVKASKGRKATISHSAVQKSILPPSPENQTKSCVAVSDVKESDKPKPHLRTYSRKRSSQELHSTSRRQSLANEDPTSDVDVDLTSGNSDITDELTFVKNENMVLEQSVKSITSFLKDHLGVTDNQLEAIQEAESNTIDLSQIASQIKNSIVCAGVLSEHNQMDFGPTKHCYKAMKHPFRGWEMIKQDLALALGGHDDYKDMLELEDHHSLAIEECLNKGSLLLKQSFTILISQMREYNKPAISPEESEIFYQKAIKDCLSEAVDKCRDIFNGLVSSKGISDEFGYVEKWVDVYRAELGKLFHSLSMTLQSLRDIPGSPQKQPITLFHLPEPTLSLALNPAKVTHSVVLEMYIRIGLAELQNILMHILEYATPTFNDRFRSSLSNGKSNNNYEGKDIKLSETNVTQGDTISMSMQESSLENTMLEINESFKTEEIIMNEDMCVELPSTSTTSSIPDNSEGLEFHRNGKPKQRYSRVKSPLKTRRLSESDYNQFKASVGNTLVSSFKKQIQEKIQAVHKQ